MEPSSQMQQDVSIPEIMPVMVLRDTVFFPQSILPLYIFEPRYRAMLRDILAGERVFVVARLDDTAEDSGAEEPFHQIATLGIIRASHENPDGTSNLVLQGLMRVRIEEVSCDTPYRQVKVSPEPPRRPEHPERIEHLKDAVSTLLFEEKQLADDVPEEFLDFLRSINDLEAFIDLTAFTACNCADIKQRLLEAFDLETRYDIYLHYLRKGAERCRFFKTLQGKICDEDIALN